MQIPWLNMCVCQCVSYPVYPLHFGRFVCRIEYTQPHIRSTTLIKWIIRDYWYLNWVHLVTKTPNLENIEFYTCTLWDHNANYLIMTYRRNSWVPNDWILVGTDETKWTTFYFMRNDVLQNYLVQFLKYLTDNFENLKFQDTRKVVIIRPPNSYILHCHGKSGLFTLYLKGNGMKNTRFEKYWILYMYTVGPQCKFFYYSLQEELMGADWLHSGRNRWNLSEPPFISWEMMCYKII